MDHDAVAALLGDPTAVISDAEWPAIQEHFAVCDLCVVGPAVLATAVQGELSIIRFSLDAGRSIFRPWWLGGPIVALVITVGILSYAFVSGGSVQTEEHFPSPTATATPTVTVTPTPAATPTPSLTSTPSPTPTPLTPTPPPSPTPSPTPSTTATPPPPTLTPSTTPPVLSCEPAGLPLTPSPEGGQDRALAERLLQLVNQARENNGLTELVEHPALTQAAQAYSEELAQSCPQCNPHEGPSVSELSAEIRARVEAAGYSNPCTPGELWTYGFPWTPAQELCSAWVTSPLHRSIMLGQDLQESGVGCYVRREEPGSGSPSLVCILYVAPRPPTGQSCPLPEA